MDELRGGADQESSGPMGVCVCCAFVGRMHVHYSEGWACRRCHLSASTVVEIRWIKGNKFHRCLKGLAPKTEAPAAVNNRR